MQQNVKRKGQNGELEFMNLFFKEKNLASSVFQKCVIYYAKTTKIKET